jgi:hypothetical protein
MSEVTASWIDRVVLAMLNATPTADATAIAITAVRRDRATLATPRRAEPGAPRSNRPISVATIGARVPTLPIRPMLATTKPSSVARGCHGSSPPPDDAT